MSQTFSRRDLFAYLASPLTNLAKRVAANEQRTQNLQALKQNVVQGHCVRCRLPFQSDANESMCPACHDAEAKNRDLMQSLFKAP